MFSLIEFQQRVVDEVKDAVRAGHKRILVVSPTGSGKTVIASELARRAREKHKRVVFLAPRRELVFQAQEKLNRHDVGSGIIMADIAPSILQNTQVCCVPTLHKRCIQSTRKELPPADLLEVDEAHLSVTDMTRSIVDRYPNAITVGFTATPARSDGRGLGELYSVMIQAPSIAELIRDGYLVKPRYFAPSKFNLEGVKTAKGDYVEKQLAEAVDKPVLWGDVVTNWLRLGQNRQTVVYGVTVAHSIHLRDSFREAGISAEHIDADTPHGERKRILHEFELGFIKVICNCQVLAYGWDCPSAACVVLARPTKSIVAYFQMVGRVLRTMEGKTDALVLDHGGVVETLGFVEEEVAWSLDGATTVQERVKDARKKEPKKLTCEKCHAVFTGTLTCPACGYTMPSHFAKYLTTEDDDLVELTRTQRKNNRDFSIEQKRAFLAELHGYAHENNYQPGWASNKYKDRFGVWPNAIGSVLPLKPSRETLSWIRSRAIAWAHSKKNPRNAKKEAA